MSRAFTAQEAREKFLSIAREKASFWATLPDKTPEERCNGLVSSMLAIFDGITDGMPAIALVLRPHADDTRYRQTMGENHFIDGTVINDNDGYLHHEYEPAESATAEGGRKTHYFDTSGDAYDETQCSEEIKNGDLLVIKAERIVAIADTWPFAVTKEHGMLHAPAEGVDLGTDPMFEKWRASIIEAKALMTVLGFE